MFILRAPYPSKQTTTVLPSPVFSDQLALKATVQTARSMNGTLYTYVKSRSGKHKLKWEFALSRNKALELREFINSYFASTIEVTDHLDNTWVGYLKNNPFEFDTNERANGWPGNEVVDVSLEFEEK